MSTHTDDDLWATLAGLMTLGFPVTAHEIAGNIDTRFEDWGLDSLAHLDLIVSLGSRFGVMITDADAEGLKTPATIRAFLTRDRVEVD